MRCSFSAPPAAQMPTFDPSPKPTATAEEVLRAAIGQAFPKHAILGEEFGETAADHSAIRRFNPARPSQMFASLKFPIAVMLDASTLRA